MLGNELNAAELGQSAEYAAHVSASGGSVGKFVSFSTTTACFAALGGEAMPRFERLW